MNKTATSRQALLEAAREISRRDGLGHISIRRTAALCDRLRADGLTEHIRAVTGLVPDAYFSATKIRWILDHVPGAQERAERGELLFGTVDSWLIWKLTRGRVHATDVTNASRTMLFDIHRLDWDETLLHLKMMIQITLQ